MRTPATGFQWAVVALCCAVATALVNSPRNLPYSIQGGVAMAVDGVARGLLLLSGQPMDVSDQEEESPDFRHPASRAESSPDGTRSITG